MGRWVYNQHEAALSFILNQMTTRVNLLLPIFEINVACNNPQIITNILQERYSGFHASDIYWLEQRDGVYECAVRLDNIKYTLDSITELVQSKRMLEETVKRLKQDIFNLMGSLPIQNNNSFTKSQILKKGLKDYYEQASVSLKMQPVSNESNEEKASVEKRLLGAISDLTRENIKLKDALSYYQVQLQLVQQQRKEAACKLQPKP